MIPIESLPEPLRTLAIERVRQAVDRSRSARATPVARPLWCGHDPAQLVTSSGVTWCPACSR